MNRYEDFERFAAVPDVYQPPEIKGTQERDNLRSWLTDPLALLGCAYRSSIHLYKLLHFLILRW